MTILLFTFLSVLLLHTSAWTFNEGDLKKFQALGDCPKCDLSGADLTGADLTGADLTKADLTGVNLREATLTGANLEEATLTGARLTKKQLREKERRRKNRLFIDIVSTLSLIHI